MSISDKNENSKPELTEKKAPSFSEFNMLKEFPNTKPLIFLDNDKKIVFVNKAAQTTFDVEPNENISTLKTIPQLDEVISNMGERGFCSFNFDISVETKSNGKENYFVEIEKVLVEGIYLYLMSFTSLAERNKIEERINSLHNAIEYGNVPLTIINNKFEITYTTTSLESIVGSDISRLYGKPIADVLKPFIEKESLEELKTSLAEHKVWRATAKVKVKQSDKWYEFLLNPVYIGSSKSNGFVLRLNDITRYVEATYEIKKNERRQRALLSNISEPILILREEKDALYIEGANDSFCESFGVDSEKIVELDFADCMLTDLYEVIYTAIDRATSENRKSIRFRFTNKDTQREYLCKFAILTYEHFDNRTFIISFFDITTEVENEKRLRAAYEKELHLNKLKTTFLSNMSHELRTPLNAVVGYSDLMRMEIEESGNTGLKELMGYLSEGIVRLKRFADNIVDIALIEAGEIKPDMRLIHLREEIEKILKELDVFAKSRKINYTLSFEDTCSFVETDPELMKKVFTEIIDNAIKYNIENGLIEIRCYTFANEWRVEVTDTGKGIAQNMLKEILKPFTQEETDGYKRNYEGLGLGLTIANKLTEALKGKLEITSELGKGTKVLLSFPIEITS